MFKVIKPITTQSFWDRIGPNPEIKNAAGSYSEVLIYKIVFNHADKLDDLKDRRGYFHLKEEALDHTMWRNRFRGGFGPVVIQNTE